MKISIIIPTYNRAANIMDLARIILRQTFEDFELIIVNDGSTDETATVLEEVRLLDKRVRIINKINGGLSSARNAGLEVAKGRFVTFIDDDDTVPGDYIATLTAPSLEDFDLIIDSYSNQRDNELPKRVHFPEKDLSGRDEALRFIFGPLQEYPYCFFAHGKRYRLDIIRDHNIRFSERIQFVEDRPFVLDYLRHCNKVKVLDSGKYIVKSVSTTNYRLSKGQKPADYLCFNFAESYKFLCEYSKETDITAIKDYADNYLASKIYSYLLVPISAGVRNRSDKAYIRDVLPPLLI